MIQSEFNDLVETLQNNVCVIQFEKVDGTIRRMECTLVKEMLPEDHNTHKGALLTEGDGHQQRISVYDLEIGEWRSFRVDSLRTLVTKPRN